MSTLAERIHRACPCRTTTPCQLGASLPKKTKTTCECGKDRFKVAHDRTLTVEPCKWEGHAIAGEADSVVSGLGELVGLKNREVATLTAKVAHGHARKCNCSETVTAAWSQVDPRCVEWRNRRG